MNGTINQQRIQQLRTAALTVGIFASGVGLATGIGNPQAFAQALLFATLAWLQPALGCLILVLMHRMTGGAWEAPVRPWLVAGFRMLPFLLLLFVPLSLLASRIFPWADPGSHAHLEIAASKGAYLNQPFFIGRTLLFAAIILCLVFLLNRELRKEQASLTAASPALGPAGMLALAAVGYFFAVDWVMSLEPDWYSTGFPLIFMAGQAVASLALIISSAVWLGHGTCPDIKPPQAIWRDLGNLMMAMVVFWTYVSFAQFLIIWSADLPHEIGWYLHRSSPGWKWLISLLVLFHFAVPFLLLLSIRVKTRPGRLGTITLVLLSLQFIYVYWLVIPSFQSRTWFSHGANFVLFLAVGGLWCHRYLGQLKNVSQKEPANG